MVSLKKRFVMKLRKNFLWIFLTTIISLAIIAMKKSNSPQIRNSEVNETGWKSNIHIFYYASYKTVKQDGYLYGWNVAENQILSTDYYPELGVYSSNNHTVINIHMKLISTANIGVIAVAWTPAGQADSPNLKMLLKYAAKYKLQLTLFIQEYIGRTATNIVQQLKEILKLYGNHAAFYKTTWNEKLLPFIYVNNAHLIPKRDWIETLCAGRSNSIRDTSFDAFFVGMLSHLDHKYLIEQACFDGFYTHFAAENYNLGVSFWSKLSDFAVNRHLIFVPSIGPGYKQAKAFASSLSIIRQNGAYFNYVWKKALISRSKYLSISSFNLWEDASQIEPAIPCNGSFKYLDYLPHEPSFYIELTKQWTDAVYEIKHNVDKEAKVILL